MSKYDKLAYDEIIENPKAPECEHIFSLENTIIRDYTIDLCDKIIKHGREGYFIESFSGRYNICTESMVNWINSKDNKEYDDFRSALKISMSASFHYWNCELIHALKNFSELGASIPVLRGILGDIVKTMPKGLRDMQFENLVAPDTPEQRELKEKMGKDKILYESMRGN